MALCLSACSVVKDQLKQDAPRWPQTRDKRVWFDGPSLRVHTQGFAGASATEDEAIAALKAYFEKLRVLGDIAEREDRIKAALKRAAPVDGRGAQDIYTTDIDVPRADIQDLLGTNYE